MCVCMSFYMKRTLMKRFTHKKCYRIEIKTGKEIILLLDDGGKLRTSKRNRKQRDHRGVVVIGNPDTRL